MCECPRFLFQQPAYNSIPPPNAYPGPNQTQYLQAINDEFSHLSQQVNDLTLQYSNTNYYGEQPTSMSSNVVPEQSQPPLDPYSNHFYQQAPNQYHDENQQPTYGQTTIDNGYQSIPYGEQQTQQPHIYQPSAEGQHEPSPYDQYEVIS